MKRFRPPLVLALCLSLPVIFACTTPVVNSTWPKSGPGADGYLQNWEGLVDYSLCDQFGVGVANDDRYLYLRLVAENRRDMLELLRNGMTAWFGTNAKKKRLFGIRFPTGGAIMPHGFGRPAEPDDGEALREAIESASRSAQILGPGKHDTIFVQSSALDQYGILARIFPVHEEIVWEARIPLHTDSAITHAVDPGSDGVVTLRLDSPAPEFGSDEHRQGGGSRGGGMGGMGGFQGGGMGRGGMGGGGFRAGRPPVQPVDAAIEIRLATRP